MSASCSDNVMTKSVSVVFYQAVFQKHISPGREIVEQRNDFCTQQEGLISNSWLSESKRVITVVQITHTESLLTTFTFYILQTNPYYLNPS